jgi:antidote-toxin recognition MazE-like antitoxin
MTRKSKESRAKERVSDGRKRPRAQGEPSMQLTDLRDPRVRADIRRQGKLLAQHPENDAIDDWIDAVYDWSEWK